MKTHTTSEAIAVLEREPKARFEAPERDGDFRIKLFVDIDCARCESLCDGRWEIDCEVPLRSDWARTDKEES